MSNELTPGVFANLWQLAKAQVPPPDPELARMQKFMIMHEDMHAHFEANAADPGADGALMVDGENLMLHIAMDAATEKSLEMGVPEGVRDLMQGMLDGGMDPGKAFHVISQAMMHQFVVDAEAGAEMDMAAFLGRARQYAVQAAS